LTSPAVLVQLSKIFTPEPNVDIVIDTSALIAVIVGEPERAKIMAITAGNTLIGPGSIPWEIGNAFSAMFKQERLSFNDAKKGVEIFESIPIRYVETDITNALRLSKEINMNAYEAYLLDCTIRYKSPLLTLDQKLKAAAKSIKIAALEV
jgi:predicted nucleic acid-binding protein